MNAIKIFDPVSESVAMSIPVRRASERSIPEAGSHRFTLRRSGARPLSFTGQQLGQRSGRRAGAARWHELNLFQMDDGRYVADIRALTQGGGAEDQFHVHVADTLDAAIAVFEHHDARQDVQAGFELDEPGRAPAELMALAAALRYRIAEAVSSYRGNVAVFLAELPLD